jgi:hypothetical protein
MKLAHLILAHNNPEQLARLVARLQHPSTHIFIHIDARVNIDAFNEITQQSSVYFIQKRLATVWGNYSIVQATFNAMEEIMQTGERYSHINLLSGQDYPIIAADTAYQFFSNYSGKSFMWSDLIFNDWIHGQNRINVYHLGDYNFKGKFILMKWINLFAPHRKMPHQLQPYGRAQWLTITPEHAAYVISYVQTHKKLKRFFKQTFSVDEIVFQTVLFNSVHKENIVNDYLRYIVLNEDFRPEILTMKDAEALIHSGKMYARKFDMHIDTAILDYLDAHQQ